MKRKVDLVIISDVHLGTYGSRAAELVNYLKSIEPKTLVLNGDIVDIWQFSKRYFPVAHMEVLKTIASMYSFQNTLRDQTTTKPSSFTTQPPTPSCWTDCIPWVATAMEPETPCSCQ